MTYPPVEVKVWASMACYTRPENKVERVSYPVPTPSAARGVLEAIYWKPEFDYRIREIIVLKPIRFVSFLRNEVEPKASSPDGISITDARQQRNTLALYDVAYIFRADIETRPHATTNSEGYRAQFRERVDKGQCFHRPYLGCREFAADFSKTDGSEKVCDELRSREMDLGLMLFDIAFRTDARNKSLTFARHGGRRQERSGTEGRERREVSGYAAPVFFPATLKSGVLAVPPALYTGLSGLQGDAIPGNREERA